MQNKRLGSLFDGSGGFPLAASLCGIEPVWASEVEPYPIAVTRSRFPTMKHLGDISKVNGAEIEPVDIITFGSPCQDLSVAGKRAGLKHEANGDDETTRSGLFMEAVRIIKEMREATNGKYPTFALWENVPGAFSSNKGEDFRIVLEELIKIVEPTAVMPAVPKKGWAYADSYIGDGWSIAYRVFDAQYWGVPQRRRRIHLVLDLRGERAGEVLFKFEGLRGHHTPCGSTRQETAGDAENRIGADDREGNRVNVLNPWDSQGNQVHDGTEDNVYPTLRGCGGAGYQAGYVLAESENAAKAYGISSYESNAMKSSNPHSGIYEADTARTLDLNGGNPACNQGGIAIVEPIGFDGYDSTDPGDKAATLGVNCGVSTGRNGVCVPYTLKIRSGCEGGGKGALIQTDMSATLATNNDQYLFQPIVADAGMSENNQPWTCNPVTLEPGIAAREGGHIYEGVCGTLRANAGDNQMAVAYGMETFHRTSEEEMSPTLKARDWKDPHVVVYWDGSQTCGTLTANNAAGNQRMPDKENFNCVVEADEQPIALDRAFFNQGQNALYDPQFYTDGTVPTLVARGPSAVSVRYIVRRLTPTECARLQGFADEWGDIEQKHTFTDEEHQFWLEVRNTHASINGKVVKDYTKKQMLTWYNKLHTDSAEYKMWGNGIALPPALYCMQGIKDALQCAEGE